MEGEAGAQVAPPFFIHPALPGHFCEAQPMTKKRDLPWQTGNFPQTQQQLLQLQHQHQQQQLRLNSAGFLQNNKNHWSPKLWGWDSLMFVPKPHSADAAEVLKLGTEDEPEQKKKGKEAQKPLFLNKNSGDDDADGENLMLKLGGSSYLAEEPVVRPNKRVRSGSPGGGGNYPMCQVDDCKRDLSNAKDYHRRHKVCELHSKTTKALVGQQMQRFCQQCSRFHPLSEFDEGKRSCRRRLAGHNRRRRKTQPEDVNPQMLLSGSKENGSGDLDIVNLLSILARLQGNNADKTANGLSIPDKDRLIQILGNMNSLPISGNSSAKLPAPGGFDLNIAHGIQTSLEQASKVNGISAPSTMDLFAVLSAALAASSPDVLAVLSQGRSDSSGDDKSKVNCLEQAAGFNVQKKSTPMFPTAGVDKNSSFRLPPEVSECPVQESRPSLPLQLFSSSPEDDSPQKLGSARKYFSSDSSNPMEERSPSSSPPVVQKLFPLQSMTDHARHERMSISREDNVTIESSTSRGWNSGLDLFRGSNGRAENGGTVSNIPYQSGYTSSSGSDHSPSCSNSDAQDRTGRIIFKLFDKRPSDFPGTLRTQILNWLSHSPSEMESYIRPGCVVLSVYASMPSMAWEELQENLLQHVNSLIQDPHSEFWRTGRFLIHTDRQLASHKDGKIRLSKSWSTWNAPQLLSVSPLAVVGGQETSLILRGRNLTVPGTKIHCTYMGGYKSKEVSGSAYLGTVYDDSSIENFSFHGGTPNEFGRCFIEVENGFKGNCFPIIIADAMICRELRILEAEIEKDVRMLYGISEDQIHDNGHPSSREDVLHFLNELGWLFQRKSMLDRPAGAEFSSSRFKFLLTFSVERDWSALVKALLDILVDEKSRSDGLLRESLETLSEIHLLNRAVKRKCKKMVNLLLQYYVSGGTGASKKYLFPPNQAGPGGLSPLHLAACTQDSEEMVDVLTDDPQEIGISCWNSLLDDNEQSPYAYAAMRNNHSYNRLVARKLTDNRNGQVSVTVDNTEISLDKSWIIQEQDRPNPLPLQGRSCAQCSVAAMRHYRRMPGAQGLLHRPYVHSMLAIAAVCVCVCLFLRGSPEIGSVAPFKWENLQFGSS